MHFHRHCMHDIRNCISFDANITYSVIVHTQCLYPVPNPMLNIRRWMHFLSHSMHDVRNCISFSANNLLLYTISSAESNVEHKAETKNMPNHA